MKKLFVFLCMTCVIFISCSVLMAGGVDNRSNYSGEYVRSLGRNAATDSLDAIAYNPAGVMKMEDGLQGNLSVHYVLKDYTNIVDGENLEQDTPSFVPALFALYKKDRWAGFFSFTIPAGGGEVDYDNGNATTRIGATTLRNLLNKTAGAAVYGEIANERLNAEAFYYGFTAGGAYKINDVVSVSLAGRYIDANKKGRATFQVLPTELGIAVEQSSRTALMDYEDSADGFGFIFGLSIDSGPLYVGMKYETETDLDFKYRVNEDSITGLPYGLLLQQGITDGTEHTRNLPALFSLGLGITVSPRLRVDAGMIYYFQNRADWGGAERNVNDGHDFNFTLEYAFRDNLKGTLGYLTTQTGMSARYALKEAPELNAKTLGLGIVYNYNEALKLDFGLGYVSYEQDSYTDVSSGSSIAIALDKDVKMISAGVQYRF